MHEMFQQVVFYSFALLAVLSAMLAVFQSNPVRCVLSLVLTFFCSAVLWMMAESEFLSLILVLVYVGAVMTLFLFVVMMLDIKNEAQKSHWIKIASLGLLLVAFLVSLLFKAIPESFYKSSVYSQSSVAVVTKNAPAVSNTEALGLVLYTDYLLVFELAAVVLLVAIVAAITLTHRTRQRGKRQDVVGQMMTMKKDRISIVSMPAEKEKGV